MARRLIHARIALPLATLATFLLMVLAPPAGAATFTVDSGADAHDLTANDGICDVDDGTEVVCTLRAAVEQANATIGDEAPTDDVVNVNVPAVQLSLAVGGVISITSNIQINGVYLSQPSITQESPLSPGSGDRVFDIAAGRTWGSRTSRSAAARLTRTTTSSAGTSRAAATSRSVTASSRTDRVSPPAAWRTAAAH